MIPKECKRLAEVDFPIAIVPAHAAREKSIRHGAKEFAVDLGPGGQGCSLRAAAFLILGILTISWKWDINQYGKGARGFWRKAVVLDRLIQG